MNKVRIYLSLVLVSVMLSIAACNNRPKVVIEGGEAPRFNLMGQGKIQVITVSGPDVERQTPGEQIGQPQSMKPYWEIIPNADYDLSNLDGPLVYGQVPKGFKQNYPAEGVPPQALFESGLFTFQLRIADGNGLGVRFTIHEGKALTEGS